MSKQRMALFTVLPIIALAAIGLFLWSNQSATEAQQAATVQETQFNLFEADESFPPILIGSPDAPVTIEEYASMSCPHCAQFHANVLPVLKERYINSGQAKLLFNFFPHNEPGLKGSMLVACAPPESRANFLKVLFSMQDKWAFDTNFIDALATIGSVGGVSPNQFNACMGNTDLELAVLKSRKKAAERGVQGVPGFFINGKLYEGERTVEGFTAVLDNLIAPRTSTP